MLSELLCSKDNSERTGLYFKNALAMRPPSHRFALGLARHSTSLIKFFHKNPKLLKKTALNFDKIVGGSQGRREAQWIRLLGMIKLEMKQMVSEIRFPDTHRPNWTRAEQQAAPKALRLLHAAMTLKTLAPQQKRKVMIALAKVYKKTTSTQEYFLREVAILIDEFGKTNEYGVLKKRVTKLLRPTGTHLGNLLRDAIMKHLLTAKA